MPRRHELGPALLLFCALLGSASDARAEVNARRLPSAPSTWALVLGGLGVAGLAVGSTTGFLALEEKGVAEDHCSSTLRVCDEVGSRANDQGRMLGRVSVVGFSAAVLGFTGAILLWQSSSDHGPQLALSPALAARGAETVLVGRW